MPAAEKYRLDDFDLYNAAREFRKGVYEVVKRLPPEERHCLDPQMRKAAVSVTNNVAEGHGRWHYEENMRFCRIARGSVEELLDDLNTCLDEGYGSQDQNEQLKQTGYDLIERINSYVAYLRKCKQGVTRE